MFTVRGILVLCVNVCLDVKTTSLPLSLSLSKFNIKSTVMGSLTGRMGLSPILLDKLPITISTMSNFDGDSGSDGDGVGTCKQTSNEYLKEPRSISVLTVSAFI